MKDFIKTLTTDELKTVCKTFYTKAQADETPVNMLSFNETFNALKKRLTKADFEQFCVTL